MSPNSLRGDCRKFSPNIFNKTKCSNCFKQKEEHSAEALECNRAMRKVAKSGYLFVAPDWDFSIPLNRTKRWQRRWFVLYDDGELNYSVDEHPDTVPQASIDMNLVLEVASAEDITGHAFSMAITAPDRVTFVKAVAREEARAWTSVLAVYTRNKRPKRNATFPGGQSTTIHQTPRSGTPNPIRLRYNSCNSAARWSQDMSSTSSSRPSPGARTSPEIITTSLKNLPVSASQALGGTSSPVGTLSTSSSSTSCHSNSCRSTGYRDQPPSSASPPTRDKLNSEEKAAVRRTKQQNNIKNNHIEDLGTDCVDSSTPILKSASVDDYETSSKRLETLKDIAQILTRPRSLPSPNLHTPTRDSDTDTTVDTIASDTASSTSAPGVSSDRERVNLPAETLLHLKKGWLMLRGADNQWTKLWFVLCGQELKAYKDPMSEDSYLEEWKVALGQVKAVGEVTVQRNYGFQIRLWNDVLHVLSAVTSGIRSNWLLSIRRAAGLDDRPPRPVSTPALSSSSISSPLTFPTVLNRPLTPILSQPSLNPSNPASPTPPSCLTTSSPTVLATPSAPTTCPVTGRLIMSSDEEYRTASEGGRRESGEWTPVSPPLARTPISRVKERARTRNNRSLPSSRGSTLDSVSTDELFAADELQKLHVTLQRSEQDKLICLNQLKETLDKYENLNRDYLTKSNLNSSLQEELNCVNERLKCGIEENDFLYKKLQELEGNLQKNSHFGSLSDLTNIDLDLDLQNMSTDSIIDEYNNLKNRFEKAVQEIKAMKRELRNSNLKYDDLELTNLTLKQDLQKLEDDNKSQNNMMAARIQDLTQKLTNSEKQVRNLKSKLQDSREKRRSLSLKGRESFSINKEVEDKITELEAKILNLDTSKKLKPPKKVTRRERSEDRSSPEERNQRRLRRKSLDSVTTSEPMKILIRLSSLESKVANIDLKPSKDDNLATSTESLNISSQSESNSKILALESTIEAAKIKLNECQEQIGVLKLARRSNFESERLATLEVALNEVSNLLQNQNGVSPAEVDVITDSVLNLVQSFEKLLTNKLIELNNRRKKLRDSHNLTSQNSLAILAEKLAYETVLISRINEALNTIPTPDARFSPRILRKEILETGSLLQQLQSKLQGSQLLKPPSRSLEAQLVKILTRHLIHMNYITNNNRKSSIKEKQHIEDVTKGLEYLVQKQKEVDLQLQRYKTERMEQMAYNLALETLNYSPEAEMDERSVREAWQNVQDRVGYELIQAEISHVLSRVAQSYTSSASSEAEHQVFLTVWAAERAALELWTDVVEERLHQELERHAQELETAVRSAVTKLRPTTPWRRRLELERKSYPSSHTLLAEFADILAHKALIDSRIAILSGEASFSKVYSDLSKENHLVHSLVEGERYLWLQEDSTNIENTSLCETEFQNLFLNFQKAASSEVMSMEHQVPESLKEALFGVELQVTRLLNSTTSSASNKALNWKEMLHICIELKKKLEKIPQVVNCSQCPQLKDSIHRLSREHSAELAVHESTQSQLRERTRQLEQRLGTLDSEYAKQLEQLRTAYRETLTTPSPASTPGDAGEGLRARYQAEIEQLRALCEKGLAVVESTHRRVVRELQDKHRREREQLLEEKEQALAEETQATLAALDAMRKAHEHEVRREVAKFKADFLRRLQATHDLGALHQQHDAEMREIQAEILALSERYSVKCVESASLEEQLCSVHQQLESANKYIEKLDKRNKQLEAVAIAGSIRT